MVNMGMSAAWSCVCLAVLFLLRHPQQDGFADWNETRARGVPAAEGDLPPCFDDAFRDVFEMHTKNRALLELYSAALCQARDASRANLLRRTNEMSPAPTNNDAAVLRYAPKARGLAREFLSRLTAAFEAHPDRDAELHEAFCAHIYPVIAGQS